MIHRGERTMKDVYNLRHLCIIMCGDSLGRLYVCLRQSRVVIGRFGRSGLPPSDTQDEPGFENEHKNISNSLQLFEFWVTQSFQIVMIRLPCFESERKSEIVSLLLNFALYKSNRVFTMLSPFAALVWVSALSGSASGHLRVWPRECFVMNSFFVKTSWNYAFKLYIWFERYLQGGIIFFSYLTMMW